MGSGGSERGREEGWMRQTEEGEKTMEREGECVKDCTQNLHVYLHYGERRRVCR